MTTVKQLVWRYYPDAFPPASDAVTPFGRYSIEEGMSNNTEDPALPSDAYPTWNVYFSSGLLSVWRTLDEAKASAQADFEQRVRSALAAPVPNGVPEGWKLVPVDITEEMWTAFFKARDVTFPAQQEAAQAAGRGWNGLPAVVWEALLAASPVTPGSTP